MSQSRPGQGSQPHRIPRTHKRLTRPAFHSVLTQSIHRPSLSRLAKAHDNHEAKGM